MKIPKDMFKNPKHFGQDLLRLISLMKEEDMTPSNFEMLQEKLHSFLYKYRDSKHALNSEYKEWLKNNLTDKEQINLEAFISKIDNARPGMTIGYIHETLPSISLNRSDIAERAKTHGIKSRSNLSKSSSSTHLERSYSSESLTLSPESSPRREIPSSSETAITPKKQRKILGFISHKPKGEKQKSPTKQIDNPKQSKKSKRPKGTRT